MAVTSRQELKDYCFRALGYPLVEVDVTDEAADDRINEALDYFREYYFDGSDRFFFKYVVTQTDIDNGWIPIPDNIWGVNNILPVSNSGNIDTAIFSYEYQFRASDMMRNLTSTGLVYYTEVMQYLSLLESTLNVGLNFEFNRNIGRLIIDTDWSVRLPVGTWIMADCYAVIDPDVNRKFWNNRLLKEYATALLKQQWARAYTKFDNIQLPGGVTINGKDMAAEAKAERQELEEIVMNNSSPLGFFTG